MIWQTALILSVAFFTGDVCARRARIINGTQSYIEQFPYQVSLRHNGKHYCGGSIISGKHILTAGHCVAGMNMTAPYSNFTVYTGSNFTQEGKNGFGRGYVRHIIDHIVHPDYRKVSNHTTNDVAVITLKEKITFDKKHQKVNLPKQKPIAGLKVNISGWGLYEEYPGTTGTLYLLHLKTELISNEECQQKLEDPTKYKIYDAEVCTARVEGSGACYGDSGGALVHDKEVVGIASWLDGDHCAINATDVYVNVYEVKDFIEAAMKK